jgi:hypothetical protein
MTHLYAYSNLFTVTLYGQLHVSNNIEQYFVAHLYPYSKLFIVISYGSFISLE